MGRSQIDRNGIRPLQDKLKAIQELKEPKNEKEFKSFLGAIQNLSKYNENLSAQTDLLRQLLKRKITGIGQRNLPNIYPIETQNHKIVVFGTL